MDRTDAETLLWEIRPTSENIFSEVVQWYHNRGYTISKADLDTLFPVGMLCNAIWNGKCRETFLQNAAFFADLAYYDQDPYNRGTHIPIEELCKFAGTGESTVYRAQRAGTLLKNAREGYRLSDAVKWRILRIEDKAPNGKDRRSEVSRLFRFLLTPPIQLKRAAQDGSAITDDMLVPAGMKPPQCFVDFLQAGPEQKPFPRKFLKAFRAGIYLKAIEPPINQENVMQGSLVDLLAKKLKWPEIITTKQDFLSFAERFGYEDQIKRGVVRKFWEWIIDTAQEMESDNVAPPKEQFMRRSMFPFPRRTDLMESIFKEISFINKACSKCFRATGVPQKEDFPVTTEETQFALSPLEDGYQLLEMIEERWKSLSKEEKDLLRELMKKTDKKTEERLRKKASSKVCAAEEMVNVYEEKHLDVCSYTEKFDTPHDYENEKGEKVKNFTITQQMECPFCHHRWQYTYVDEKNERIRALNARLQYNPPPEGINPEKNWEIWNKHANSLWSHLVSGSSIHTFPWETAGSILGMKSESLRRHMHPGIRDNKDDHSEYHFEYYLKCLCDIYKKLHMGYSPNWRFLFPDAFSERLEEIINEVESERETEEYGSMDA